MTTIANQTIDINSTLQHRLGLRIKGEWAKRTISNVEADEMGALLVGTVKLQGRTFQVAGIESREGAWVIEEELVA